MLLPLTILAFLIGSIPCGYLVGRFSGVDIREHGSGNIGATNANRVLGKSAGLTTLICDIFKGSLTAWIALAVGVVSPFDEARDFAAFMGFMALLGHCFSPFLNFKGGKGVATGLGAFMVVAPFQTAISVAVFAIVLKFGNYVSLASITAALTIPVLLILGIGDSDRTLTAISVLTTALIIYRHKTNILRLRDGGESKFKNNQAEPSAQ